MIRRPPIKALVLDIDGVITDGTVLCSSDGPEQKRFAFRDVDAVFEARRRGLFLALVTGESSPWVDTIATRLEIEHVVAGAKDKLQAVEDLANELGIPLESICYVGDSDRDAPALQAVGLGLVPSDASPIAMKAAHKVLSHPGGAGAVAQALSEILEASATETTEPTSHLPDGDSEAESMIRSIARASLDAQERAIETLAPAIARAAEAIVTVLDNGGTIYAFGNGGSASDAEHLTAELIGRFEAERPGLAAVALTATSSVTTALGNDYGFDAVFARQIAALGRTGDVAVAISTSGNSKNVVTALQTARDHQMTTIGLTGRGGGRFPSLVDIELTVPSDSTARIQEAHRLIIHLVCGLVERRVHSLEPSADA